MRSRRHKLTPGTMLRSKSFSGLVVVVTSLVGNAGDCRAFVLAQPLQSSQPFDTGRDFLWISLHDPEKWDLIR